MAKENIRSIRMSNEIMEIIEQQQGRNFTEKFERLVYNCYILAGNKEKEIETLSEEISIRKKRIQSLEERATKLEREHNAISRALNNYSTSLNIAIRGIENM